jgi:hypothetical protein
MKVFTTKLTPQDLFQYVYTVFGVKETLAPFREGVLSYIGLEFAAFETVKYGKKVEIRFHDYRIIDQEKFSSFQESLSRNSVSLYNS